MRLLPPLPLKLVQKQGLVKGGRWSLTYVDALRHPAEIHPAAAYAAGRPPNACRGGSDTRIPRHRRRPGRRGQTARRRPTPSCAARVAVPPHLRRGTQCAVLSPEYSPHMLAGMVELFSSTGGFRAAPIDNMLRMYASFFLSGCMCVPACTVFVVAPCTWPTLLHTWASSGRITWANIRPCRFRPKSLLGQY